MSFTKSYNKIENHCSSPSNRAVAVILGIKLDLFTELYWIIPARNANLCKVNIYYIHSPLFLIISFYIMVVILFGIFA